MLAYSVDTDAERISSHLILWLFLNNIPAYQKKARTRKWDAFPLGILNDPGLKSSLGIVFVN